MSKLYFHTRDGGTAALAGFEYQHLRYIVQKIANGAITADDGDRLRDLMDPAIRHSLFRTPFDTMSLAAYRNALPGFQKNLVVFEGEDLNTWHLVLNTAMALGSDPIRLATRISAQADMHAWVSGPNRHWMADIIEEGLKSGVYRRAVRERSCHWENVLSLLRAADNAPVVMSYSVESRFPNADLTEYDGESSAWEALTEQQRWDASMAGLIPDSSELEIHPESFGDVRFGHGLSLLDLLADDYVHRIHEALTDRKK